MLNFEKEKYIRPKEDISIPKTEDFDAGDEFFYVAPPISTIKFRFLFKLVGNFVLFGLGLDAGSTTNYNAFDVIAITGLPKAFWPMGKFNAATPTLATTYSSSMEASIGGIRASTTVILRRTGQADVAVYFRSQISTQRAVAQDPSSYLTILYPVELPFFSEHLNNINMY